MTMISVDRPAKKYRVDRVDTKKEVSHAIGTHSENNI